MTSYRSLNHTKWACQYHVVFIPKYRKKAISKPCGLMTLRDADERKEPR